MAGLCFEPGETLEVTRLDYSLAAVEKVTSPWAPKSFMEKQALYLAQAALVGTSETDPIEMLDFEREQRRDIINERLAELSFGSGFLYVPDASIMNGVVTNLDRRRPGQPNQTLRRALQADVTLEFVELKKHITNGR